ncbi:EAL domain-containing protein [Salinicola rhizosphaerae]|uniref:Diguanylate phosphodiesterase n=1 Tax=Salinicola rhizosphaerae TaxID=1443141 RepID=A0ABQ3E372_9GAMM|nr:EAL domain-containing protein [Salinicola rhizosphaerae]GHB21948.1 diguanylate phosphodiesterase [Salinicola rhizosphaerae]
MPGCARYEGRCVRCESPLAFDFTMAFQPLVDVSLGKVYGFEALVRGPKGESAESVLNQVDDKSLYRFDQACRVRAIEMAEHLGIEGMLSINFLPNAVYEPEACIQATLATAERVGWPVDRLCFEIIETESVRDRRHLQNIVDTYRAMGLKTAVDDFGTGHANLDLLIDILPDVLKLDRQLISHIDESSRQQIIVDQLIVLAAQLDITLIAEGVERLEEARWLYRRGITRQQGYWFARPATGALPRCSDTSLALVRGVH